MPDQTVNPDLQFHGEVPPHRFNMARYCLSRAARTHPDKIALMVFGELNDGKPTRTWTYAELEEQVRRISGSLLAIGLTRGDRLLIRLENCAEYALLFFAAIGAGIVPIPASTQLTGPEVAFFIDDSGASALAIDARFDDPQISRSLIRFDREEVADMAANGPLVAFSDTRAEDPAYLIYTSGTSSHPKGVLHAHRAAWGRRPMYRDWYDISADDVVLHAGAFNWTYTLGVGLTDPWANGATAVVYTGDKDIQVWPKLIDTAQATIFAAVPTVYRQILKYCDIEDKALGSLRHGLTAGESLPPAVAAAWRARTGIELYEAFGMSEISTYISTPPGSRVRSGSPGKAQNGRVVEVLPIESGDIPLPPGETGIISIHKSDPGMMLGYWNRSGEEAEMTRGDWFLSGDLARIDGDGYVWLAGRADNMMNAMGYRVSPVEVEAVLMSCAGVAEAAAVACEVREDVQIICAFIVAETDGGPGPTAEQILDHAKGQLASYKAPREVIFLDHLPRTPNGKVKHRELRDAYRQPGTDSA